MTANRLQLIEGGRVSAEIRRAIHAQLFDLGQTPREVARRNGRSDADVVHIALEYERELADRRADLAYRAGRRSLLTPPPALGRAA